MIVLPSHSTTRGSGTDYQCSHCVHYLGSLIIFPCCPLQLQVLGIWKTGVWTSMISSEIVERSRKALTRFLITVSIARQRGKSPFEHSTGHSRCRSLYCTHELYCSEVTHDPRISISFAEDAFFIGLDLQCNMFGVETTQGQIA